MKSRSTTPEASPRLTGREPLLVQEYLGKVSRCTLSTVAAARRHPNTHPYLIDPGLATAAGRVANEAVSTPQSTGNALVDRTYEMMGLSGRQQHQEFPVPHSLAGHVSDAEVAAARQLVEESYRMPGVQAGGEPRV